MFVTCHRLLFAGTFATAVVWSSLGVAQTQRPSSPTPDRKFAIPGSADSVSPSQNGPAQRDGGKKSKRHGHGADARPRPGAPVATFPGFRLLPDGGSRIYVELTKNVTVDERRTNGAIVYTLRGAQVLSRNNKNALITTHFATPVARARLVPAGTDVELSIDLRTAVEATHQVVAGENGTVRLEVDFPAGDYPLAPGLYEPPPGGALRTGRGRRTQDADEPYPADEPLPSETPSGAPTGSGNNGAGPPTP